jgi:alkylation response protein AidB-like acyl-CoA dehydrogenase
MHCDAAFSRRCGERGFIGVMFPRSFGGRGGTALERYVIYEEMLAAGAPVGHHWFADRQSGPLILKHGSAAARAAILPEIAAGRCCIAVGMSEPGAGSDLAAIRTKADKTDGGWRITGSKLWTSNAHRADFTIVLARTGPASPDRHAGLTHFIVSMKGSGVRASPINDLTGGRDLNEVMLDDVFVPDEYVLGAPGNGWALVTSELTYERSGPDRFLSTYVLLTALVDRVGTGGTVAERAAVGRLVAHLATLRAMSSAVAERLDAGQSVDVEGALVKDLGTAFEREVPETARRLVSDLPQINAPDPYRAALAGSILAAPAFTIRGGTREILRGIIARRLGLR